MRSSLGSERDKENQTGEELGITLAAPDSERKGNELAKPCLSRKSGTQVVGTTLPYSQNYRNESNLFVLPKVQ